MAGLGVRDDGHEQKAMVGIQTLEWLADEQPDLLGVPRRSGFFEIVWIKSGSGTYHIDLQKHPISPNAVYCIDAGQLQFLRTTGRIEGYKIVFSPQFLCPSADTDWFLFGYRHHGMARIIQADTELQLEMEEITGKMKNELARCSLLHSEVLKGLLKILLIHLMRRFELKSPVMPATRNDEVVGRFMALLEDNVTRKKMVSDYAGELNMSAGYLNEIIKRVTGFPAHYHINQRKVLEAKRQVMHYGISMKEIAYSLGFDDQSHFSKFFKVNTGSSFLAFRKQVRGHY